MSVTVHLCTTERAESNQVLVPSGKRVPPLCKPCDLKPRSAFRGGGRTVNRRVPVRNPRCDACMAAMVTRGARAQPKRDAEVVPRQGRALPDRE